MDVQSIRNYNTIRAVISKNTENYQIDKTVNTFSTKEEKVSTYEPNKKYLFRYGHDGNGKLYHVKGSIAEDSTKENPKIKIEYFADGNNKATATKYIEINKINPRNATLEEYNCLTAYLFRDKPYYAYELNTTGIDYNRKDRYDFVSLLERDIKMYQANSVRHHVSRYQDILKRIESHMSTDYYKKNVETGKRGIGVEEALTISRKQHGIPDSTEKINKVMNMVDKYLESNRQKNIQERNKQAKMIQAKRKHDKEKLENLLEKLKINRKLTQDKIFETQEERKENIARMQKENLLKNNPYDFR